MRRVDLGFLIWILTLVVILSLTVYRYFQAIEENKNLVREYEVLERSIEEMRRDMDFIRGEVRGEVRRHDLSQTEEGTGTQGTGTRR